MYQIVRKLVDDQTYSGDPRLQKLSTPNIYERIKRSNSSLNRKSKKLLEDSIERVIEVWKQEQWEAMSDDDVGSMNGSSDGNKIDSLAARENDMNRRLVGLWGKNDRKANAAPSPGMDGQTTPQIAPAPASPPKKRQAEGERPAKRRKAATEINHSPPTHVDLRDIGGVDHVIQQLDDLVVLPLLAPEFHATSKIQPPRGILLHGPPGCGKTMIANAFAADLSVPLIAFSAPSIVSGMSGESEKALRDRFDEAKNLAPCLIFIDEIDAITPKRESAQREMEKRIVAQLLTCMDDLALEKTGGKAVIVLAATNRPDSLDPGLRRGGRFDKEINLGVPNETAREQILRALTRQMVLIESLDFRRLAKATPGFVGADLNDLVSTAGSAAIKRYIDTLKAQSCEMQVDGEEATAASEIYLQHRRLVRQAKELSMTKTLAISVTNDDFLTALPKIQPSALREGFATIPGTTFADVGALRPVREELLMAIVDPIKYPKKYERVGITAPSGVLLWGPPGCGKTLLAKAVANESKANFISVKGPELLNKYVGESEKAVRQVFVRARSSIPCVIFFDEIDALAPTRESSLSEASSRVVNTFLSELDGMGNRQGIYVIAATNRPEIIDPAMLRPGRLETLLFVGLPEEAERIEILETLIRDLKIEWSDDMVSVAKACEGFSGADLGILLRQAGRAAIKRDAQIQLEDFEKARKEVKPSVRNRNTYEKLLAQWGSGT